MTPAWVRIGKARERAALKKRVEDLAAKLVARGEAKGELPIPVAAPIPDPEIPTDEGEEV